MADYLICDQRCDRILKKKCKALLTLRRKIDDYKLKLNTKQIPKNSSKKKNWNIVILMIFKICERINIFFFNLAP